MAKSHCLVPLAFFMILFMKNTSAGLDFNWYPARATFYGDMQGSATIRYGLATTALSTALFNNGLACGACFEIMCVNDPQWCIKGVGSIKVTTTNFCPPNSYGNWCRPPQRHFDLPMRMFTTIANYRAGVIPVMYRRAPCYKTGGVKFEIKGNHYWLLVLVYNVANAGDVYRVSIKGSHSSWFAMSRNWGQNWQTGANLLGQALSFQVTTSDDKTALFNNVAPPNWQFGQTYGSNINF